MELACVLDYGEIRENNTETTTSFPLLYKY